MTINETAHRAVVSTTREERQISHLHRVNYRRMHVNRSVHGAKAALADFVAHPVVVYQAPVILSVGCPRPHHLYETIKQTSMNVTE